MENTHIEVGSLVKHKHYGFEGEVIGHHHGQVIIEITEGEAPLYRRRRHIYCMCSKR